MYFSRHNDNVVFSNYYRGPYTLFGKVLTVEAPASHKQRVSVCAEDVLTSHLDPKDYLTLVIDKSVCRVAPGFIELFSNLKDLIVEADLDKIELTPGLEKLLLKNNVILRGSYNSPAEKMAKKLSLRFIHKNIFLSRYCNREYDQSTELTLCFQYKEPPFIWREDMTSGISAGNSGGGTVRTDYPKDFYVGYDAEKFAEDYVGAHHYEMVRANEELAAFLAEANRRRKK